MLDKIPAELLEPMIDALPIEITLVDADDRIVYYSKGVNRIFKRAPDVIGKSVDDCHPPAMKAVMHSVLDGFRNGTLHEATSCREANGKRILIQYYPIRDKGGNYLGAIETGQDITFTENIKCDGSLIEKE